MRRSTAATIAVVAGNSMIRNFVLSLLLWLLAAPLAGAEPEVLFATHCAVCHGDDRLGGIGPALIPESLGRLRGAQLEAVIAHGRAETQMPAFSDRLSPADIESVARLLHRPLPEIPVWNEPQIEKTLTVNPTYTVPDSPQHGADPLNLFIVVETGDHHISILDGDRMEVVDRLPTPVAVHGAPKFSPDGRFVFLMSRDGWVQKVDLWNMTEVARIRAGVNSRNIAISDDGKWLAVANFLPMTMTILSTTDLRVAEVHDVIGKSGTPSRISGVYVSPSRQSFVLALKDVSEIWEVFYGEDPPFYGFVHDHRDEGPLGYDEPFPVRQIALESVLEDFLLARDFEFVMGARGEGLGGRVVDLVIGHTVAELDLDGMPHFGAGVTWERNGAHVMAAPNLRANVISVIDLKTWENIAQIQTSGPGLFLRTHEKSPYIWADEFFGGSRDAISIIDKQSLEVVDILKPARGMTAAHVEFDRHGKLALVSLWDRDGAVVVYDALSLVEIGRLPMNRPSGKYNVFNMIIGVR